MITIPDIFLYPVFLGEILKISGKTITAAILDMDGVLWRSDQPICDLKDLFEEFSNRKVKVILATNNGTHSIDQYQKKMAGFGVDLQEWQIVTSSMAVAFLAKKRFANGGPIYMMGSSALKEALMEQGFFHTTDNPQAVIAGLDWEFNYKMIKDTTLMIRTGIPFYFTNPDPTYPTPEGIVPGAGALLASLEAASGVKAQLAGKPEPFLFELAMQRLNSTPQQTLVVGDRLSTDILGGYEAGCTTIFVLSGVNNRNDLINWSPQPDFIIENICQLFSL